jgi:hypothetical protein
MCRAAHGPRRHLYNKSLPEVAISCIYSDGCSGILCRSATIGRMTTLRAKFDGRVLIPIGPVDLPTNRELEIQVHELGDPPRGSPAALVEAMKRFAPISREDADALDRAIDEGKLPPTEKGVFDELG